MKKTKRRSLTSAVTLQDLQEMSQHIVSTMEAMFSIRDEKIAGNSKRLEKVEERLDKVEQKLERSLENDLIIIDELKAMREEQAAQALFNVRISDTLEHHEQLLARCR